MASFGVLNETTPDHLATLAVDTRNNLLFPVHLGVSFDFDEIEFVWDEMGGVVGNGSILRLYYTGELELN